MDWWLRRQGTTFLRSFCLRPCLCHASSFKGITLLFKHALVRRRDRLIRDFHHVIDLLVGHIDLQGTSHGHSFDERRRGSKRLRFLLILFNQLDRRLRVCDICLISVGSILLQHLLLTVVLPGSLAQLDKPNAVT